RRRERGAALRPLDAVRPPLAPRDSWMATRISMASGRLSTQRIGIFRIIPPTRDRCGRQARSARFRRGRAWWKATGCLTCRRGWEKKKKKLENGRTDDPEAKCYMGGIPRSNYLPYPFQIVQSPVGILFVYEYASSNRLVNMGKPVEAGSDTWMGTNTGHWEGD